MGRANGTGSGLGGLAGLMLLAGCAGGAPPGTAPAPGGIAIGFEVMEAPAVFRFEGPAAVEADGGAGGAWASVPGLPRPETGRVRRAGAAGGGTGEDAGRGVLVALFRGQGGARLSAEAGAALGAAPGERLAVEIVALRREPRLIAP